MVVYGDSVLVLLDDPSVEVGTSFVGGLVTPPAALVVEVAEVPCCCWLWLVEVCCWFWLVEVALVGASAVVAEDLLLVVCACEEVDCSEVDEALDAEDVVSAWDEVVFAAAAEVVVSALLPLAFVVVSVLSCLATIWCLAAISWAAFPMKPMLTQVACVAIRMDRATISTWTNRVEYMVGVVV